MQFEVELWVPRGYEALCYITDEFYVVFFLLQVVRGNSIVLVEALERII